MLKLQFRATAFFLLSPLHGAVEGFLLRIESGAGMEKVKTGNCGHIIIRRCIALPELLLRLTLTGLLTLRCSGCSRASRCLLPCRIGLEITRTGLLSVRVRLFLTVIRLNKHNRRSFSGCEPLFKSVSGELSAQTRTVKDSPCIVVYECRSVYAPGIGMAQDKVDVPLFELRDEIILARRFSHSLRYSLLGRTDVDVVFRPLHPSVYRRAAGELAEAGSLERRCYCIAVVVSGEIDKTVIFPSVDPAVGLLTPDIIQSKSLLSTKKWTGLKIK